MEETAVEQRATYGQGIERTKLIHSKKLTKPWESSAKTAKNKNKTNLRKPLDTTNYTLGLHRASFT